MIHYLYSKAYALICRTRCRSPSKFWKVSPPIQLCKIPRSSSCLIRPIFLKGQLIAAPSPMSTQSTSAALITGKHVALWQTATLDVTEDPPESYIATWLILWTQQLSKMLGGRSRRRSLTLRLNIEYEHVWRSLSHSLPDLKMPILRSRSDGHAAPC